MIKLENVSYTYNKGRPDEAQALFDISADIPSGSVTAVIGHTGSGKSTLIQLLNGLIKPQSGRVLVNGTDTGAKSTDMRSLRSKVGMVFQYPEHQLFEETVELDIAFGPRNMGLGENEIRERVKNAAVLVGLSEAELKRSPFELSGGQQRRAAIAGVLAMEPEVLVMDEPAAGLDPEGRDRIFGLISRLNGGDHGMTVIFVSHSMEEAARYADNIIVMNEGRIAMSGTPSHIFSMAAQLRGMGLDIPAAAELCIRLSDAGFDISGDILTVEDAAASIKRALGYD